MPAITCPSCGAPTRVSVFSPDWMACAGCRYAGAPPPGVRDGLRAAAAALSSVDVRRRQIGWMQQRIGSGSRGGGGIGCLAVQLVFFGGCGGCMVATTSKGDLSDVGIAAFFLGPALFTLGMGIVILRELAKTRRRLELACAAVPPSVPGQPPGCHVCGADLPVMDLSRQPVARCRHCAADNVVRPDVLSRAASLGIQSAETLLVQVRGHALALAKHGQRSAFLIAMLALLAPFASCLGIGSASVLSPSVDPTDELVLVRAPSGACVALVGAPPRGASGVVLTFGAFSMSGAPSTLALPRKPKETFRATKLVGREVFAKDRRGKVVKASRNAFIGTEEVFLDASEVHLRPHDLCVVDPSEFELVDPPAPEPAPSASAAGSAEAPASSSR